MPATSDSTGRQIVEEHRQLNEILEAVQQMLRERQAAQNVVIATLRELVQAILNHFEHEEAGGYFAAVAEASPQLGERARKLLLEHPAIADRLLALQLCAVQEESLTHCWEELSRRFDDIWHAFAIHEAAEDSLLQEAYGDDIGAED